MLDVKVEMQKQSDQARFTVTRRAEDDAATTSATKSGSEQTLALDEETSLTPRGTLLTTKSHVARKRKAGSKASVAAALRSDTASSTATQASARSTQQQQQQQRQQSTTTNSERLTDAPVKGFDDYEFSDDDENDTDASNKRKLHFKIHSPRSMRKLQTESPSASANADIEIIGLSPPRYINQLNFVCFCVLW